MYVYVLRNIIYIPLTFNEDFKRNPRYKLCNLLVYPVTCIKVAIRNKI